MTRNDARYYAIVKHWKDNPTSVQVIDYFFTLEGAKLAARQIPKSEDYTVEVMKYE